MESSFSSLYLHIPFCIKRCNYCGFYSLSYHEEIEALFLSAILNEIRLTKDFPHLIKTIYIGGGTPSCLPALNLEKILEALQKNYKFIDKVEFTVEINPGTITKEKINLLKTYGVNRISIGVQSFLDKELSFLGRIHDVKEAIKTVYMVLNSGIENISIDLIFGIPGQTLDSFKFSLNVATSLQIRHISIYELNIERGTHLEKKVNEGKVRLLNEKVIEQMYMIIPELLEEKGFYKYEISNFAQKGFECLHNINYWLRGPYLGLGPSAHSYLNKKRFHNPVDIFLYCESLQRNKLSWIDDCKIDEIDELKEKIILGLRMKKGIIINKTCLIEFFKDLENFGLTRVDYNRVYLTDKGMLLSNEIFVKVLSHIENCSVCKQE